MNDFFEQIMMVSGALVFAGCSAFLLLIFGAIGWSLVTGAPLPVSFSDCDCCYCCYR